MVPYGVGLRRPNMGFAGIRLIVTPRGPYGRNDRYEVGLPSSRQGLFRFPCGEEARSSVSEIERDPGAAGGGPSKQSFECTITL